VIVKGNHDYYFDTLKKMNDFFLQNNFDNIFIIQNNSLVFGNYCICGFRGWSTLEKKADNAKIIAREEGRLKLSLEDYKKNHSDKKLIVIMHYPPFCGNFLEIIKSYNAEYIIYGHLHNKYMVDVNEINKDIDEIKIRCVSCDMIDFNIQKIVATEEIKEEK